MATIEPYALSDLSRLAPRLRSLIQHGGIVALPTDTYYGLGGNPFNEAAVDRLFQIKGRADGKPILVLIGNRAQLPLFTNEISSVATLLMDSFWPGPLTILFPAHPSLPRNLTAGTETVGIRLSAYRPLTELLASIGPLTGTSANRSGASPAQTAQQVQQELGGTVDLILDAGATAGALPSTVVDAGDPVRVIREGAVSRQMIQNVLQTRHISLV